MGFPALGKLTSSKPRAGVRTCSMRHLFRNLRMLLWPIRAMTISRREVVTVESVSSSTKVPTSIPSRRRAMASKPLQLAGVPNPLLPQASLGPSLSPAAPNLPSRPTPPSEFALSTTLNPLLPYAIPNPLSPQAAPNQPHLSRPSLTSRCSASCTEAEMGALCSSSIVRPAISLPSTHRSSCKLSILGFGCRGKAFLLPPFNRPNSSGATISLLTNSAPCTDRSSKGRCCSRS